MSEKFTKTKKKNVTVKIDPDVLEEARKKNLNISKICRYALELAIQGKLLERPEGKKSA